MKKLAAKLSLGIFSLGLCVNLSAEEWRTYKLKNDAAIGNKFSDDVIILNEGDKAEFVNFVSNHYCNISLKIKVRFDEDFEVAKRYYANLSQENPARYGAIVPLENFRTIYGPCKIFVGLEGSLNLSIFCNVKITRAHESQGRNVTGYSLVLPESKDTNYNLVLESSTDLVSWTADATGTKAPSDKKRFYRLRAVKE